jgi:hypothetical protein
MRNCLQLIRKTDMQGAPVSLNQIDREICDYMGVECHPGRYAYGWFDVIGFQLAAGKSFDDIDHFLCDSECILAEQLREINQWLAYYFSANRRKWHPNLAPDDERRQCELTVQQINVAWDLIQRARTQSQ